MSVHPSDTDTYDDAPAAPTVSSEAGDGLRPFAGVPARDYLTDALAAILLLVSLGLPWTTRDGQVLNAGEVAWVLPVTLLSLLSLSVFYLARLGTLPASWTVQSTRKLRLLAALPYTLAVLAHLVLDGVGLAGFQGIGSAAALGLAGVALAATPRRSELGPEELDRGVSNQWWRIGVGLMIVTGLLMLAWAVLFTLEFFNESTLNRSMVGGSKFFALVLIEWFVVSAVVLVPAFQVVKGRSRDWRRVLAVLGSTLAAVLYLGGGPESVLSSFETLQDPGFPTLRGAGLVLLPALAAVLASPAITRQLKHQHPVTGWLMTANAALRFTAIASGMLIVVTIVALVNGAALGAGITTIVILAVLAALSVKADKAMLRKVADGRRVALAVAGLSVIFGIMLLNGGSAPPLISWLGSRGHITWVLFLIMLGLPILILVALTMPSPVREFFATNKPSRSASGATAYVWHEPEPAPAQVTAAPAVTHAPPHQGEPQQPAPAYMAPPQDPAPRAMEQDPAQRAKDMAPEPIPGSDQAGTDPDPDVHQAPGRGAVGAGDVMPPAHEPTSKPEAPAQEAPVFNTPAQEEPTLSEPTEHITAPLEVGELRSEFTPEVAADPTTPGVTLAEIVEQVPELRPYVAVNPTTYPALLEWLGELGDPAVDEALRSRNR